MTDELCPRCGWVLGSGSAACPSCGALMEGRGSGFDTVFYPEAAAAEHAAGGSAAPGPGTAMLRAEEPGEEAGGPRLKRKPTLTRRGGSTSGQRLGLDGRQNTVGRGECEIRIDDPTISGRHFRIEERGHEYFLRDLGSTNGTFLNGHLVRSAPLKPGDEIRAGESVFVFSVLDVVACD